MARIRIQQIKEMKEKGEKFAMLTAYDYLTAKIIDEAGIPLILVGDSLGNVVLGYETTIPVTMDVMIHHTKAVTRAVKTALVVGDMPFMSYQISMEDTLRNAARFIQEAGAHTVKLEGGVTVAEQVKRIVDCGIPVMGHIGLTPQSINQLSGRKIQGKTAEAAKKLLDDAIALDQAGAFAVVLETVPAPLAALITRKISIPTIGIGAGSGCDGQVQVVHDVLGLTSGFVPKHAKQYAQLAETMKSAVAQYQKEVKHGDFPTEANSFPLDESVLVDLK
jgi:3-methyl-2-oxobutanoate hydroxymethyltransferase